MAEEGEKKEAESKKHTYPLVRVSFTRNTTVDVPSSTISHLRLGGLLK